MPLLSKNKWKKWLSWFGEIPVESRESEYSGKIEVVWVNGRKVLNSERANYSFGSLYRVFQKTFKQIQLEDYTFQRVLILGFGAGGTARILRHDYAFTGIIHGVELDSEVIQLAKSHFPQGYASADRIFETDADEFVRNSKPAFYDLIIFDVYVDLYIPEYFQQPAFINALQAILSNDGMLIYNKVMSGNPDKRLARELYEAMRLRFSSVQKHTRGLQENLMFVCRK
ncbi:MAG: spermidine synthase [Bacteroidota bacterium]